MNLKAARVKLNMTQVELADRIGLSAVAISRIEQGHVLPRLSTRQKITEIVGNVDWPDTGSALTANEQRDSFRPIELASVRAGFDRVLRLFADRTPDEIREVTAFVLVTGEMALSPPETETGGETE